jgi:hypothetical protein
VFKFEQQIDGVPNLIVIDNIPSNHTDTILTHVTKVAKAYSTIILQKFRDFETKKAKLLKQKEQ